MGSLSLETSKKIETAVESMPAFPKSVEKILDLSRDINSLPKDIVSIIEKDPVMTIKILKVLNSPFYAVPDKVISINRAVIFLGLNTVKNLALSFALVGALPRTNSAGFDMDHYLHHSLITAGIARQLATLHAAGNIDPMDCYIAGLLHDFGKVVFAQFMPEEFHKALVASEQSGRALYETEREFLGVSHPVVGSMLAERWKFPENLVESIRRHHDLTGVKDVLSECIYLANTISNTTSNSGSMPQDFIPADWRGLFLKLTVEEAIESLGDINRFVTEADMFLQTSQT